MEKKMIFMPFLFAAMIIAMGYVVMLLWNWLMPGIFELRIISFWEAVGLVALPKILFGGFHGKHKCCGGNHGGKGQWKHKFKSKWHHMSEEEKSKWESKFGHYCQPKKESTELPKTEE